jgi:hypothetical protein
MRWHLICALPACPSDALCCINIGKYITNPPAALPSFPAIHPGRFVCAVAAYANDLLLLLLHKPT